MEFDFNGVKIYLKDQVCTQTGYIPGHINPQINLYIKPTNLCNSDCSFCEYHGKNKQFNWGEFVRALIKLSELGIVGKIQITGGEPTVSSNIIEIVKLTRLIFPDRFIGINSNFTYPDILLSLNQYLDNFALSRHHYDDAINRRIFGNKNMTSSPSIKQFIGEVGQEKVHLSCTMIQSGVGTLADMKKYLDFASSLGCSDVGFVGLMKINDYCKENFVEPLDIAKQGIENGDFLKYKEFNEKHGYCTCGNYEYFSDKTGKSVSFYIRHVLNPEKSVGSLVFDGQHLRSGFSGEIIPLK